MMHSFSHWTPRYVFDRCREILDHRLRPNDPWLAREAIGLLERLLKSSDIALEFGCGRSTLWLGSRVSKLTSVEHDPGWHATISKKIESAGLSNVTLLRRPKDVSDDDGGRSVYVRVLDTIADNSIDFVLVDGVYRNYCAVGSAAKLKYGGIMVIDNANWFLPSRSRSPASRSLEHGPVDRVWKQFAGLSKDWRRLLTSSGVTDTLILIKT